MPPLPKEVGEPLGGEELGGVKDGVLQQVGQACSSETDSSDSSDSEYSDSSDSDICDRSESAISEISDISIR